MAGIIMMSREVDAAPRTFATFRINAGGPPVDHGQAEPRPLTDWLGCVEWVERSSDNVGCHASARIAHAERDKVPKRQTARPRRAIVELAVTRFNRQLSAVRYGISCTDREARSQAGPRRGTSSRLPS